MVQHDSPTLAIGRQTRLAQTTPLPGGSRRDLFLGLPGATARTPGPLSWIAKTVVAHGSCAVL